MWSVVQYRRYLLVSISFTVSVLNLPLASGTFDSYYFAPGTSVAVYIFIIIVIGLVCMIWLR